MQTYLEKCYSLFTASLFLNSAVLVDGKDPLVEAKKLAAIWKANVAAGKADL